MWRAFADVDVVVAPTFERDIVLMANVTGYPAVCVPNGFQIDGTPVSISFIGRLYGEASALALAKAYQDATRFHEQHPPRFAVGPG
jgi:Asp-tRNA(Asn)/Glu-tRNA(Gln) amidotransferase A subunit family amidase